MTYLESLTEMLHDGVESLSRSVANTPEDKLDWRPAPDARTARELMEELVMTTDYTTELLKAKKDPGMGRDNKDTEPKSLAELEEKLRAAIDRFLAAAKEFPEAELHNKVSLPWGEMTFFQTITYPYWNLMYHWGQINYIQTMYGDKKMY